MFGQAFWSLHAAVRPRVVSRYLGQILLILAALTLVPAGVAWASGRADIAARYALVILVFGVAGGAGTRLACTDRIQTNEALVITALAFLISGLAMAYPMTGYGIAPLDAVFEAISGVTTTGLSTLDSVENRSRSFLFARAWLQWIGGLGVVVLALAFVISSSIAAKHLGFDEREVAGYVGGTRAHARRILLVYLILTIIGFALCLLVGMSWFPALANVLAAVSTGGFSTADASLAAFSPAQRSVLTVVCFSGAVSFSLYYRGSLRSAWRDAPLRTLLLLIAAASVVIGLQPTARPELEPAQAWHHAVWMAASAQTSAGFATLPVDSLAPTAQLALIASMLVGGEIGSTAGGLKVLRFLILVQLLVARMLKTSTARGALLRPRIGGTPVRDTEIEAAAALVLVYAAVIFVSWMAFVAHGHDPLAALFDVTSALGTVGLSAGTVGPELEPALKAVLCFDMLLGRVEIFAFIVLIFPPTWIGRRRAAI